jgi:predicted aldo/keto reductase-like oxidoreductase
MDLTMQYRKFGKLDWKVSALGFGCMRLPLLDSHDHAGIDEKEASRMIYYAIDHGLNYIDTAYGYHHGNSERFLGRTLKGGYREKVHLATKLPCWNIENSQDFDKLLNEQLEKLQTDRIDFYLLHGMHADIWHKVRDLGVIPWAEKAMADGRIQHLGFSFHDKTEVLMEIIDAYSGWTLCQVQYNYMDVDNQAGTKGVKYAASKGLAVIAMEPILGGRLVNPPSEIQTLWDSSARKRTPADWALQWVWNQPEVTVALSGMSKMNQVEENLASADISGVNSMTAEELALIDRVRDQYQALSPIPCNQCNYCMPCPNGVNIPRVLETYNHGLIYNNQDDARQAYTHWIPELERANNCIACKDCEGLCPQSILVSQWMPIVHEVLGEGKPYVKSLQL